MDQYAIIVNILVQMVKNEAISRKQGESAVADAKCPESDLIPSLGV